VEIICIERVLIGTNHLEKSCERWQGAGFAIAPERRSVAGIAFAQAAAGGVQLNLCALDDSDAPGPLGNWLRERGDDFGGAIGWTWGIDARAARASAPDEERVALPSRGDPVAASVCARPPAGVVTALVGVGGTLAERRARLASECGRNCNTVEYLDHVVVMAPALEDEIAGYESLGIACRRTREAGGGMRQAFFKLEETVLEVVGPSARRAGVWGLAFMCADIGRAVACARESGFQVTEPRAAVQGGAIARIIEPLDGLAVAFMQRT
jgi:predicted enzyme related to lactoylglutathione lyase